MSKFAGGLALLLLAAPAAAQPGTASTEQVAAAMRANLPRPVAEGIVWTHVRGQGRDLVLTMNVERWLVEGVTNEQIGTAFAQGFCVGNGRQLIAGGVRVLIETRTDGAGPAVQRATVDRCP